MGAAAEVARAIRHAGVPLTDAQAALLAAAELRVPSGAGEVAEHAHLLYATIDAFILFAAPAVGLGHMTARMDEARRALNLRTVVAEAVVLYHFARARQYAPDSCKAREKNRLATQALSALIDATGTLMVSNPVMVALGRAVIGLIRVDFQCLPIILRGMEHGMMHRSASESGAA